MKRKSKRIIEISLDKEAEEETQLRDAKCRPEGSSREIIEISDDED